MVSAFLVYKLYSYIYNIYVEHVYLYIDSAFTYKKKKNNRFGQNENR